MGSEDIIYFHKGVKLKNLGIHIVIPIYHTKEILIIAKQPLVPIECKWLNEKWKKTKSFTTEGSAYGWTGAYTCPMSKKLMNNLLGGNESEIQLRLLDDKKTKITAKISDHHLVPSKKPLHTVVESLNPIFFDSSDPARKKTITNFNKHCGSILRRFLPWIEFHLMRGVDQIFVNQPIRYKENGEEWISFWKELLKPYLKSEEVKLIMFEDMAEMARINEWGGCTAHASHQNVSQLWTMWLNKGRSVWFGNHDLDEYITPRETGYFGKEDESIAEVLEGLASECNYVETKMFMVEAPPKEQILLAGNIMAADFMPKCHKFFVRIDDVNLVWCHGVTNWENPVEGITPSPFRLNHYRIKIPSGWMPSEAATIERWNSKSIPHINEKNLSKDRKPVLNRIKKRYGMNHGKFLRFMQQKYSHLKELKTQNLIGE
ncbi:MAG: hypothetical protein CMI54_05770 [Parcubacteria group bacterium]|nr:hypothetical protein [Parcubacteria group bacterium]|tara:strand:+ start:2403 stop:3695 length:1293 start_codon:yes stop_codon:yes gene_type:complete